MSEKQLTQSIAWSCLGIRSFSLARTSIVFSARYFCSGRISIFSKIIMVTNSWLVFHSKYRKKEVLDYSNATCHRQSNALDSKQRPIALGNCMSFAAIPLIMYLTHSSRPSTSTNSRSFSRYSFCSLLHKVRSREGYSKFLNLHMKQILLSTAGRSHSFRTRIYLMRRHVRPSGLIRVTLHPLQYFLH